MNEERKKAEEAYQAMRGDTKKILRQGMKELSDAADQSPFGRLAKRAVQAHVQKDPMSVEELVEGLFEELDKP